MTAETLAKQNVLRRKAYNAVRVAISNGTLVRPTHCEKCGKKAIVEAHHERYEKFLDVHFYCHSCHKNLHKELEASAWQAIGGKYNRKAVNNGKA